LPDSRQFDGLAQALGIRRRVSLLETTEGAMPLSFGVVRPAVLLPADAAEWSEDRRRVVMLHELAHIRRGDLATQILARAAVALFWWNPLVWTAWREFVKERERAADDLVLVAGEPATGYATHLLDIARSMQPMPVLVSAAVAMAHPSQLEGRLMAILDRRISRQSARPRAALAAAVLAIALVAPFAALQAQDKADAKVLPNLDQTIRNAVDLEILDAAASAYADAHAYDGAQKLLDKSLTLREQTSGDHSSVYAVGLMKLGDLSVRRGKADDALDFYSRAVALGDTPETAPGLIYLAQRSFRMKDTAAADGFIERALAAANSGAVKGRALTVQGNFAKANGLTGVAELHYLQALAQDPAQSTEAAFTMETYAKLLTEQTRTAEAEAMQQQALLIRQAHVAAMSPKIVAVDGEIATVGGAVSAPSLVWKQEPEYSEEARQAKYQGTVMLGVVIGPDGNAGTLQLMKSLGFGLDEKAADAVLQWKFKPAVRDGQPVAVRATVEVNFRLL
jgi:TonB family protein